MHSGLVLRSVVADVVFLAVCGGCVSTSTVKNESRATVRFASPTSAQVFYEAYITKIYTRPMGESFCLEVGVPVRMPYEHREYLTDNVYFNAAVNAADTNHDGVISEEEAKRYRDSVRPLQKGIVAVARR
jgi:hypothetical protein